MKKTTQQNKTKLSIEHSSQNKEPCFLKNCTFSYIMYNLHKFWIFFLKGDKKFKVHLTPKLFSAEMKLCSIHIKNLIILSVSGIFKGFKNWQKIAEICYQLVHDLASRGLALFLIWRHRLIYMALTLCEHACKSVCDIKSGIDPCPSPARSWTNW